MNLESGQGECLDAETLAAFAQGKLKRSEIPAVLRHLERCGRCMSAVETADVIILGRPRSFRGWLAVAAVIAAAAVTLPLLLLRNTPMRRLVQLAPRSIRDVEPRLSGGFAWAPYRGPMRATDDLANVQRFKLIGETASIIESGNSKKTADAQHEAGIALVLIDRPGEAIERLRLAADKAPNDANAWNDLAAAEYAAALRLGRASLYPEALAHADRAIRIDGALSEALFNRALILERLGLTQQARDAWDRYLKVDSSSSWANEGREHRARLQSKSAAALFKDDEPRLRAAASRGEQKTVDAIVDRYRQQSRSFAEAEYLGRWGQSRNDGDLAAARAVGEALARISGELLLRDAVAAIDSAGASQRAAIAEAHAVYRRGRIAYSNGQPSAAEPDLRHAAALFRSANDPMALVAFYYAANTRLDQNDTRGALAELSVLRRESDAHPRYIALGAQLRWEVTICLLLDGDWNGAIDSARAAENGFERLGEKSNLAFVRMLAADALLGIGRPDDGWAKYIQSFAMQSEQGAGNRLPVSVDDAAFTELSTGRVESARALLAVTDALARQQKDDVLLANSLVREALLDVRSGESRSTAAPEAMQVAMRISDPSLRARAVADANLALGAEALASNPRQAKESLTRAIDDYAGAERPLLLPEANLLRARAELRTGDRAAAQRDLDDGIARVERHPATLAGAIVGSGVYDAGNALFEEAIRLALDRGDPEAAFRYSEQSSLARQGAEAASVATIRQRLAGSDAAIVELKVLPGEVVAFTITANDFRVARSAIDRGSLTDLVARDGDASATLFNILIRPSLPSIERARQLIVVADPLLQGLSFAGLYDSSKKQRLVESMPVSMALSASSLLPEPRAPRARSVLAMVLPSGEQDQTVALPGAQSEAGDVGAIYGKAVAIDPSDASVASLLREAPRADVIHIAGHTQRQPGPGDDALLFAARGGGVERVTWRGLAAMPIGHPIVVLAACETLRVPASPRAHALSVGGGFLAAGASAVIGTLVPIADDDAREIFRIVHRGLAGGDCAAVAVQRAQIEELAKQSKAWRAIAVMVSRIPSTSS
jgi:tetratricopeptide (TPR) repeat protein